MDLIAIAAAFALGLLSRFVGLPPLVGFLVTGFVLYAFGVRPGENLETLAEMGVTLLLFSIGLKLRLQSLLMPQIWSVAALHMSLTVLLLACGLYGLGAAGLSMLAGLDWAPALLVAFALSFSSTVLAVKVLEEKGEMSALYGRISIGILIMQDIAAVVYLAVSTGKVPSLWALALLALVPGRHLLFRVLERAGHGELLILFGLTLALGGAQVFDLVGIKGDLGALILGILLSTHAKSSELSRHLLGFKDLFLVGFFLSIGLSGLPSVEALGMAALLVLLVPIKGLLFFWLMVRFRLRSRTAFLGSLGLASYSEFGLIVGALAVNAGWLGPEWLVMIAVAVALSFVFAAPFNSRSHDLYVGLRNRLKPYEGDIRIPEEQPIDPGDASVLVFGMGRVGTGAYDVMRERYGDTVVGLDFDMEQVEKHRAEGRRVIRASAADPDFWDRFHLHQASLRLIMLALPSHQENLFAAYQLSARGHTAKIAAIAKYADEVSALREAGVHAAFNLYAEAGTGFANDAFVQLVPERAP